MTVPMDHATMPRLGTVSDDRSCLSCGTELLGCDIRREPFYDMPMVSCPTCSRVNAVQFDERLTRTGQRWMSIWLAMWALKVVVLIIGAPAAMVGIGNGTAQIGHWPHGRTIEAMWQADTEALIAAQVARQPVATTLPAPGQAPAANMLAPGTTVTTTINGIQVTTNNTATMSIPGFGRVRIVGGRFVPVDDVLPFRTWWAEQDQDTMLAALGGFSGTYEWASLNLWWVLGPLSLFFGGSIALLAPGIGWRGRAGILVISGVVMFGLMTLMLLAWASPPDFPHQAALAQLGPPVLVASVVLASFFFVTGLLCGRWVARWAIRFALPGKGGRLLESWLTA